MSGGFFRGTSADQDTRFSNKQAKLLKSQKFPPELDYLVNMTKVKMDVIRPWIATRVTELLGFDDEVLINFIFELLEGKEVDGKQIQIQLTGFMDKNAGKFMRELWGLLLSAQNNVSGVPQQFLDAKEEETRKKKEEMDRISQEIQKRRDKDGREPERERKSRFDGDNDGPKFTKAPSDAVSKFSKPRESSMQPEDDREVDGRRDSRAKNGHSSSTPLKDQSTSPRISRSPTRSNNKITSRSRSHSEERENSRGLSVSSQSPRHSASPGRHDRYPERRFLSPKRRYRSPPRRSLSPHRRHSPRGAQSPLRRRSPYLKQSPRSRHRSPSPFRCRSPLARRRSPRRRSRSPLRRRSPSPLRYKPSSPRRQRSPSPFRRRSPIRRRSSFQRRSPSPARYRSPLKVRRQSPSSIRQRSPVQDRSPIQDRSVSLSARGRSPSPLRRRSPPPRSPKNHRRSPLYSPKSRIADSPISPPQRKRSCSPYRSQSPAHRNRRSLSRERDSCANGNESRRYRDESTLRRIDVKKSPVNHALERELAECSGSKHKFSERLSHKSLISLRSPQRDMGDQTGNHKKMQVVSPENSHSQSDSPTDMWKISPRTSRRSRILSKSPVRKTNISMYRHDSPATGQEEQRTTRAREVSCHRAESSHKRSKDSHGAVSPRSDSNDRREFSPSPAASVHPLPSELKKNDSRQKSDICLLERHAQQLQNSSKELEYAPGRVRGERSSLGHIHGGQQSVKQLKADITLDKREYNEQTIDDERRQRRRGDEYRDLHHGTESITRSRKKMDKETRLDAGDSDSQETNSYRNENVEKRRHKKSDKRKRDYDESSDSEIEDKKEAKRRRKDEKRLRKEEKRRRREERHHKKLERRAGKMKMKSIDTVSPPSAFDMIHSDAGDSDGGARRRKNSHPTDTEEADSEQKKLEIQLREKALESLRAKKAISR